MSITIPVTMLISMHVSLNFAITQLPGISKLDRLLKDAPEILYISSPVHKGNQ